MGGGGNKVLDSALMGAEKVMATTDKTQLLNRARSIQGHMGAIVRMLEDDADCVDLIKQTQGSKRHSTN